MNDTEESHSSLNQEAVEQVRQLAADIADLEQAGAGPIADNLARWLAAQYVVAIRATARQAGPGGLDLKTLRAACGDAVALRRGDHYAARLRLERERLELDLSNTAATKEKEFWEWTTQPDIRAKLFPQRTRDQQVRRVFDIVNHCLLGTPLPPETEDAGPPPAAAASIYATNLPHPVVHSIFPFTL